MHSIRLLAKEILWKTKQLLSIGTVLAINSHISAANVSSNSASCCF